MPFFEWPIENSDRRQLSTGTSCPVVAALQWSVSAETGESKRMLFTGDEITGVEAKSAVCYTRAQSDEAFEAPARRIQLLIREIVADQGRGIEEYPTARHLYLLASHLTA